MSALQAWTAGAHLDHGTLLTSWPRQARRVLGLLGGPRYEFAAEHARSTLRAEIRRRGRAQLSMQGSLQQLLGELFAPAPPPPPVTPPPPPDTAGQGAPEKAVDEEGEESGDEGGGPLVEQDPPHATAGPSMNAIPGAGPQLLLGGKEFLINANNIVVQQRRALCSAAAGCSRASRRP